MSRTITIKSEPSAARAYLDNKYIGETPVTVAFKDYGTRRIRLQKENFQTFTKPVRISAPWYQRFPLDFLCEVLIPHHFKDVREFSFSLGTHDQQKQALLRRANKERKILAARETPGRKAPKRRRRPSRHH